MYSTRSCSQQQHTEKPLFGVTDKQLQSGHKDVIVHVAPVG